MNRIDLIALAATTIIVVFTLLGSTDAERNTQSVKTIMSRDSIAIIDASHRLTCQSRRMAIEALTIAKKSINLALDVAIESI